MRLYQGTMRFLLCAVEFQVTNDQRIQDVIAVIMGMDLP